MRCAGRAVTRSSTGYSRTVLTLRWALGAVVLVLAAVVAALVLVGRPHATATMAANAATDVPAATWPTGRKAAPAFDLTGETGAPFSLASLRGRPVVITFIDPLCRDYCPTEAQHLSAAVRSLPEAQKPAIVAVSVNTAGNARATLQLDRRKWKVVPQWRWAVGEPSALSRVWRAYGIQVLVTTRKIAGVNVRYIGHTEAAYVIDRDGFERALFVWPYTAKGVLTTLRSLPS
jgi:cytochrome oxidase Cu insertion factor (SCO1/SenC/PrrC family)